MADLVLPELVPCPPMRSRMTAAGCVRMWASTREKPPEPHEARVACVTCPLGAQRSGIGAEKAVAQAHAAALEEVLRHHCARCSRKTARLINGRTCVSCYNRTREAVLGANAKGTRPWLADVIHAEALVVSSPAQPPHLVTVDRVATRMEAAVVAAREAGPGAIIGVPPLHLPVPAAA